MEYVVITNNSPNGVFIMTQYGDNAVSVHTEQNYIIWVWHNATNDEVNTVGDSVETISVVFISE